MKASVRISRGVESLFGTRDENIRLIEAGLGVQTHLHDSNLEIEGEADSNGARILPGMYVQVKLGLEREEPAILIPARTLAILNKGPHVVTVEPDGTIRHRPVTLGRDFGAEIEVVAGLKSDDLVVVNPPDSLVSGQEVNVVQASLPGDSQ